MPAPLVIVIGATVLLLSVALMLSTHETKSEQPTWQSSILSAMDRLTSSIEADGLFTQFLSKRALSVVTFFVGLALLGSLLPGTAGTVACNTYKTYSGFLEQQNTIDEELKKWVALVINGGFALAACTYLIRGLHKRAMFILFLSAGGAMLFGFLFIIDLQIVGITSGPFEWANHLTASESSSGTEISCN